MEILDKLFGSGAKVKIMRMYLFNPNSTFDVGEISSMIHLSPSVVRKELGVLEKINFVRKRSYIKQLKRKRGKKTAILKKRAQGWGLDLKFPYIPLLQNFLINTNMIRHKDILRKLNVCGKLKLVIIAGVFIHDEDSRVDMLIVGDQLKRKQIENVVTAIEAELGKEIKYASFETQDFAYRLAMRDMLIRDILDYPHEKVIDKIGVAVKA
jgi:hypothetical protein